MQSLENPCTEQKLYSVENLCTGEVVKTSSLSAVDLIKITHKRVAKLYWTSDGACGLIIMQQDGIDFVIDNISREDAANFDLW